MKALACLMILAGMAVARHLPAEHHDRVICPTCESLGLKSTVEIASRSNYLILRSPGFYTSSGKWIEHDPTGEPGGTTTFYCSNGHEWTWEWLIGGGWRSFPKWEPDPDAAPTDSLTIRGDWLIGDSIFPHSLSTDSLLDIKATIQRMRGLTIAPTTFWQRLRWLFTGEMDNGTWQVTKE